MKIGFTTGYRENFWRWPWGGRMYGGSEHMVVELATTMAGQGHDVSVRLPYPLPQERIWRGVRWLGSESPSLTYERLFSFDDFDMRDWGQRVILVACRSDPPPTLRLFDRAIFLSKTHARLMGHPEALAIGGGVDTREYDQQLQRTPRLVIYTSSPDRGGAHAGVIGGEFNFVATYRGANELERPALVDLQKRAKALIHPCDPLRPSEFFCMAVLEALAAGTPCVISDADALPELWGEVAIVLPRPIRYTQWLETVSGLITDKPRWEKISRASRDFAKRYDWRQVTRRYLEAANE